MPASPGYPFIRAGRRRCSETPYVRACALRESSAGAAQRERRRRRGICIYRCEMAALLAWRAACVQWRRLCACMLGRIRACLPGIASAIASSCAWLVCSVVCAKSAAESKAGNIVCHMVCGVRVRWVKLDQWASSRVRAREKVAGAGCGGLASERVRSEPVALWCAPWFWGDFFLIRECETAHVS